MKKAFRWNKNHFSQYLKGYHLVKKIKICENSGPKLEFDYRLRECILKSDSVSGDFPGNTIIVFGC